MICSWIYTPEDGGEAVTIGSLHVPPSPEAAAIVLRLIETTDREQAEEWRQTLATGGIPSHDPAASWRAHLRRAHRELGMSAEALANRWKMDVAEVRSLIQ